MLLPDSELLVKVVLLLLLANGTPVVVKKLLGSSLAMPVDGGKKFIDGRTWFGSSKTIRGIISSVFVTTCGAVLIGFTAQTGLLFSIASLSGDLVSSFIKRRLGLPPGSKAPGLDQLPESILPLLLCWRMIGLDIITAITIVISFYLAENILSKILFRLNIRDHPY